MIITFKLKGYADDGSGTQLDDFINNKVLLDVIQFLAISEFHQILTLLHQELREVKKKKKYIILNTLYTKRRKGKERKEKEENFILQLYRHPNYQTIQFLNKESVCQMLFSSSQSIYIH